MKTSPRLISNGSRTLARILATLSLTSVCFSVAAVAQDRDHDGDKDREVRFYPGNLVLSRSVYDNNAANVAVGTILPPNCASTTAGCPKGTGALYNGAYPYVWNNGTYDSSFGITSRIYLDQLTPYGYRINSLEVPNSSQRGIKSASDQLVTSFPSKSELGLHLSTDGKLLTFMGYVAPINQLDISNSNTPGVVDPTNPVGEYTYRAVATVDRFGKFTFTETNAYSGNNGRAAILNNSNGANVFYTSGNAGNGGNPQPNGVILGAGAQLIDLVALPQASQNPGTPTPLASFSITELGLKADKIGKDDNFRGITVFNDVVYFTKGSGGNGVNTVYFVDTVGGACPNGIGLPKPGATLPINPLSYDVTKLQTVGLSSNMCILAGFPSIIAKTANPLAYPFGLWFADANTLYVADEGDGYTGGADLYTHAAGQTTAGLQKWVFDTAKKTWSRAYTLQTGLQLGTPYIVHNYPTGNNSVTNLPWAPATGGLRNITGFVDKKSGEAIIWGITSTVSGNGDVGADPNRLVAIRDVLSSTTGTPSHGTETFYTLQTAKFAEVLRGVSLTPETKHLDLY